MTIAEAKAALLAEFPGKPIAFQAVVSGHGRASFRVFSNAATIALMAARLKELGLEVGDVATHNPVSTHPRAASVVATEASNE